jgi:photosystem II stability/assembly factor-like uncharacterized protein
MSPLASRIARLLLLSLLVLAAPQPAFAGIDRWTLYGPTGSGLSDVLVDPRSPGRMWITAGTLYKSEDGGVTFHPWGNGLEGQMVGLLLMDPGDPDVLYAGTWDDGPPEGPAIFRSQDGGAHWSRIAGGPDFRFLWTLKVAPGAPGQPGMIFAGTDMKLLRSIDGGASFQPVIELDSAELFQAVAADRTNPGTVYAATLYQRFKSTDFGTTWTPLCEDPGNFPPFVHDLVVAPGDSQRLYETGDGSNIGPATWRSHDGGATWEGPFEFHGDLLAVDPGDSDTVYGGSNNGLFVSHDGGETFTEVTRGVPSLDINETYFYGVNSFETDPARPGYALAATPKGLFATADGGRTWQAAAMRNLVGNHVGKFRIDPHDPSHWILSSMESYVQSHDSGRTFTPIADSLQRRVSISTLEFDPFVPNRLWALVWENASFKIYASKDGGATWFRLASELYSGWQLLLPAPRVLLIAGDNKVYRSADAGHSWHSVPLRAQSSSLWRMQQDPRSPRTIYWQGYRSVDAGRTWHFWTTGSAIAFDPFRPRTVHVARGDTLLVTRDAGASFQVVGHFDLQPDSSVSELLFDHAHRDVLYAVTVKDGILRSRDGGATWEPLNDGLPQRPGAETLGTLVQDPIYSHRFYFIPDSVGLYRADFTGGPLQ